jgi:hypothetical protein
MFSNSMAAGRVRAVLPKAACVAATLVLLAPAARAQGLFDFFDVSPRTIVRGIVGAGYQLRGPLMRRGDVYVADVSGGGYRYRMVIDARTGQILERYPERDLLDERPHLRQRDLAERFSAPPRPPGAPDSLDVDGDNSDADIDAAPPRRHEPRPQVARGDQSATPPVINGDEGMTNSSEAIERAKPKPRVSKHKTAPVAAIPPKTPEVETPSQATPTSEPRPSAAPEKADEAPASVTPPRTEETPRPAATPKAAEAAPAAESPKPVAAIAPSAASPSPEPTRADPRKATVAAAKPIVEAEPAPKPTPKPKSKAVNDLPVNPLD